MRGHGKRASQTRRILCLATAESSRSRRCSTMVMYPFAFHRIRPRPEQQQPPTRLKNEFVPGFLAIQPGPRKSAHQVGNQLGLRTPLGSFQGGPNRNWRAQGTGYRIPTSSDVCRGSTPSGSRYARNQCHQRRGKAGGVLNRLVDQVPAPQQGHVCIRKRGARARANCPTERKRT